MVGVSGLTVITAAKMVALIALPLALSRLLVQRAAGVAGVEEGASANQTVLHLVPGRMLLAMLCMLLGAACASSPYGVVAVFAYVPLAANVASLVWSALYLRLGGPMQSPEAQLHTGREQLVQGGATVSVPPSIRLQRSGVDLTAMWACEVAGYVLALRIVGA